MKWPPYQTEQDGEIIAGHGEAKLIRRLNGDYVLVGGLESDRAEMKEWISLFMKGARIHGIE